MKILAIDKVLPEATPEKLGAIFMDEVKQIVKMHLADVVREVYFRQDRSGIVLMLECPSLDEARGMIDTLPLVKEKLIDFDLIPLGPFMPLALLLEGPAEAAKSEGSSCGCGCNH